MRKLLSILFFLRSIVIVLNAQAPYPQSTVINEVRFDWSSHYRVANGSDNWPVTWADDDNQYIVWGDGGGFGGTNSIGRSSLGVARIEGSWHDPKMKNAWGGFEPENEAEFEGKSYGIICVDQVLYMWVGMFETKIDPFKEVRMARSSDHGASWELADWSFTKADQVMMPTVCNFGRNNENARDEYVYSYLIRYQSEEGPDDYEDKVSWLVAQKPGMIDLARVHKDSIFSHSNWSFYAGGDSNGKPTWSKDISRRQPVFVDPNGVGWCISVVYNPYLNRYILCSEHTETHRGKLGMFDAPEPWGPWTTVGYFEEWGSGHIPQNTFYWNFPIKWMDPNGEYFSLIFTGRKENDSFNMIRGRFVTGD